MTITQTVFISALIVFGPLFGFAAIRAALRARPSRWTKPAKGSKLYNAYVGVAALFAVLSAYAGWLLSGLQAMETYPRYPYESPGEMTAVLYTLPGFISGLLAVVVVYVLGKRFNIIALIFMVLAIVFLAVSEFFFVFFGLLWPVPYDPPEGSRDYTVISARGLIKKHGSTQIEAQSYDAIHFKEGLAAYTYENKWGYINKKGEIIIKPQFEQCWSFSSGLAAVKLDGKYGYINKKGVLVIKPVFAFTAPFSEGLAAAMDSHEQWGYLDKNGYWAIQPVFEDAADFSEGHAWVKVKGIESAYINKTGKIIKKLEFNEPSFFSEGHAIVSGQDGLGYIDTNGNLLPQRFFSASGFSESLAPARRNIKEKFGYIDKNGAFIIAPGFDEAWRFSEGLARVRINGKYGYVDKSGNMVIPPDFTYAYDFSNGLAVVKIGFSYGYIDKTGKVIVQPIFSSASNFSEGLAAVTTRYGGKVCYIDRAGKIIIDTKTLELKQKYPEAWNTDPEDMRSGK